jgi:ligand-binding SRPBCC domain-containing protein
LPKTYILVRTQWVPQLLDTAFDLFSSASNLQSITPPWLDFHITAAPAELSAGSQLRYKLRIHGIPVRWTTEITAWNPPHSFIDVQLSGPYALWRHEHTFVQEREGTTIHDEVRYAIPFGIFGRLAHWTFVNRDLRGIFDYRGQKIHELLG